MVIQCPITPMFLTYHFKWNCSTTVLLPARSLQLFYWHFGRLMVFWHPSFWYIITSLNGVYSADSSHRLLIFPFPFLYALFYLLLLLNYVHTTVICVYLCSGISLLGCLEDEYISQKHLKLGQPSSVRNRQDFFGASNINVHFSTHFPCKKGFWYYLFSSKR